MLDEEDRHAAVDDLVHEAHQLDLLLRGETGGRLVEEKQRGVCRKGARDLETALRPVWKVACVGVRVALDAHEAKQLDRAVGDAALLLALDRRLEQGVPELRAHPAVLPQTDVVQSGHVLEEPDVLEGACDAERGDLVRLGAGDLAVLEDDAAGRRRKDAGDPVEERGLPGAVRTDEGEDLALLDVERHIVHGHQAAETFRDVVDAEDGRRGLDGHVVSAVTSTMVVSSLTPLVSSCSRCRLGSRPCGLTSITTTRMSPNTRNLRREMNSAIPG